MITDARNDIEDEEERLSVCCGAPAAEPGYPDSDLCSRCKEHSDFVTEKELENM